MPKKAVKRKGGRRFPHYVKRPSDEVRMEVDAARRVSAERKSFYDDGLLFLVVIFTDSLKWLSIRRILKDAMVRVVSVSDDGRTVKVSMQSDHFPHFREIVSANSQFIEKVRESTLEEKADQTTLTDLREKPESVSSVQFELASLSGIGPKEKILGALNGFLSGVGKGRLEVSYDVPYCLVLAGDILNKAIETIAEKLESVSRVRLLPRFEMMDSSPQESNVTMQPISDYTGERVQPKPVVCILDTGINALHDRLSWLIRDKYDFSTLETKPCRDLDGHGSAVAGLAAYGQDLRLVVSPVSCIVAIKAFHDIGNPIYRDMLLITRRSVNMFKASCRVFNLSFAADSLSDVSTDALDDMIYNDDVTVVAAAGNVLTPVIVAHLRRGDTYPSYLLSHVMFFPADCKNATTVGGCTDRASRLADKGLVSPFSKRGPYDTIIKPEVVDSGGNLDLVTQLDGSLELLKEGFGVSSSWCVDNQLEEDVGTSFSSPIVASLAAQIHAKYPMMSSACVKALIISSCEPLRWKNGSQFDTRLQGFGRPTPDLALASTAWRVTYTSEGEFTLQDVQARNYHRLNFMFPDEADRLKVSLCVFSSDLKQKGVIIRYRLRKPGVKGSTSPTPVYQLPAETKKKRQFAVRSSHVGVFQVRRGGRGLWHLEISPAVEIPIESAELSGPVAKYGCAVVVESSKRKSIHGSVVSYMEAVERNTLVTLAAQN